MHNAIITILLMRVKLVCSGVQSVTMCSFSGSSFIVPEINQF